MSAVSQDRGKGGKAAGCYGILSVRRARFPNPTTLTGSEQNLMLSVATTLLVTAAKRNERTRYSHDAYIVEVAARRQ